MIRLVLVPFFLLSLSLSLATPTDADDEVPVIDLCRDFSQIANIVMASRQKTVPMSETLPAAMAQITGWADSYGLELDSEEMEDWAAEMVMLAYDAKVYPSNSDFDEERQGTISEFENDYFEQCYKGLKSNQGLQSNFERFRQQPEAIPGGDLYPSTAAFAEVETGYYSLPTTSTYDGQSSEEVEYSISHIAVDVNSEEFGTKLQAGIARSGLVPIGVYFDYNSDGEVDSGMAIDFVRDIPFIGRRLAEAYDPEVAQSLYSIFVMEREKAAYTSAEDMANAATEKSSVLWTYVMDNYDAIAAWIESVAAENTDDQSAVDSE